MGHFILGHDEWWGFETRAEAENSFNDVHRGIIEHVMPWFEDMRTTGRMIEEYRAKNTRSDGEEINRGFTMM